MKMSFISIALILAFYLGLYKKFRIPKIRPAWIFLISVSSAFALIFPLFTPVYLNLDTVTLLTKHNIAINSKVLIDDPAIANELSSKKPISHVFRGDTINIQIANAVIPEAESLLLTLRKIDSKNLAIATATPNNSILSFPYVPGLEKFIRIFPIHVPMAWVAALAFVLSLINSIKFLRSRNTLYDNAAYSAAFWGVMFCLGATVTGMIWAKHSWGSYWNWDPRETSIFLLLLIYFAYFALRSAISNQNSKGTLSAAYSIIAGISMPFFIFILPRISSGLHPGSADNSAAPLIGTGESILDSALLYSFSLSLFAFTALFFMLYHLHNEKLNKTIE